jgi:hypothetical protein
MKKITKACKQCNTEFYGYEYANLKRTFCSKSCRAIFYNHLRAKNKEERECPVCHNLFDVTTVRTKYCSIKCREIGRRKPKPIYIPKPPRIKQCGVCGKSFQVYTNAKFCADCRETEKLKNARAYWKTEKYKEAHKRLAREWQKNNPLKDKASRLAKCHPDRLNILFECLCEATGKHHHHFDYSKPYDVILLCDHCHAAEHARLRRLLKPKEELTFSQAI